MNKKDLSERDICTKFITPNLTAVGWDIDTQIREEVGFTDGRIYVRGKLHTRGARKRADYILYYKPNIPIEHSRTHAAHLLQAVLKEAFSPADTQEGAA